MRIYNKIRLPEVMSISSVVTLFTANLDKCEQTTDMHDFWELVYVRENKFSVLIDDRLYELLPGECIIYPPLSLHIGAVPQNSVLDIISFDSESQALSELASRVLRTTDEDKELVSEIIELGRVSLTGLGRARGLVGMEQIESVHREVLYKLKKKIELLLLGLYAHETDEPKITGHVNRRMYSERLIGFLKMNINKTLTLEDMARELSISVSRLKVISCDILGTSPIDYFITLKMEAAMRLISDGNLNFTEISDRLGFSSVHYFSKLFKKRLGITPSEFAKGGHPPKNI